MTATKPALALRRKGPSISWQQQKILNSRYVYSPDIAPPTTGLDTLARREPDQFGIQATLPLFDGFKRYNSFKAASLGVEGTNSFQ